MFATVALQPQNLTVSMTVYSVGAVNRVGRGDTVMTLTDTRIRNAKPKATAYKLSDGGGMYLLITTDGARYWRLDYRFAGKRRTLALGVYPIVTLSEARTHRELARRLLAQDIDPSVAKKAAKHAAKLVSDNPFETVGREWIAQQHKM